MKRIQKVVVFLLTVFMIIGFLPGIEQDINAANVVPKAPKFTMKTVNKGTGVRITITNPEEVEYRIFLTKRKNSFSDYMVNNGKYEGEISSYDYSITKKGNPVYTIKGLPKGTYTFKVAAYKEIRYDEESFSYPWGREYNITYSKEKSIKVKKAKNSAEKTTKYNFSKVKKGDIIEFGSYEQDSVMTNGKEKIRWKVLSKTNKELLLLSEDTLAILPYDKNNKTTWKDCSLRKWMNNVFYKEAFNKTEKKMILTSHITEGYSITTKDKVFLLSGEDIFNTEYGFPDRSILERIDYYSEYLKNTEKDIWVSDETEYAKCQGIERDYFKDFTPWWIRNGGAFSVSHTPFHESMEWGIINTSTTNNYAVRPVIRIKLS